MGRDTILLYKEKIMKAFQITNLEDLSRALIGFDRMFNDLDRKLVNQAHSNYPPHNIIVTGENQYEIQMAVTGFNKSEVQVSVEDGMLIIKGESNAVSYNDEQYIHRGLATRDFARSFPLAEHIEVKGAEIQNGMIIVKLERNIPESAKPKIIDIVEIK